MCEQMTNNRRSIKEKDDVSRSHRRKPSLSVQIRLYAGGRWTHLKCVTLGERMTQRVDEVMRLLKAEDLAAGAEELRRAG